jgi:hypothetical protein
LAKFIKTIVDRINLANRKGLCPYFSPDQICAEVHAESMNIWNKYIQEFEKTKLISMFLEPLRSKEQVSLSLGIGTLSTSKGHYKVGVMVPVTSIPITEHNIATWANAINDSVRVPSADYPICLIDYAQITVKPTSIAKADVHFVKKPTKPVYAYTTSGDDYIYVDADSVDFEWPEQLHDAITNRVLTNLGVPQQRPDIIQYGNLEQQKEGR